MKQAQVTNWGEAPKYLDVAAPGPPSSDQLQLQVLGAGLHALVKLRAAGIHYSARGLPHIPGVDGIGKTADGKLFYFSAVTPTGGSFTETINVSSTVATPVPDGADPIQIAGLVNPIMASWMALTARTTGLQPGFTAVIIGATGLSGSTAVSVARLFGAGKVIGVARSAAKMTGLGLDATIELAEDQAKTDYSTALDADVILDFLYGPATLALFEALQPTKPVQYVQIGTTAATSIDFPGALVRGKDITIRGSGPGAWRPAEFLKELPSIIEAIAAGKIRPGKFQQVKLQDIETVWAQKGGDRIIIVP